MTFPHQLTITIFLSEVPLQLVNHPCSGLTQEDHFCSDPTADLKDLREAFSDREESTRTFFKQGLLPDGVWSSRLHKLIVCFRIMPLNFEFSSARIAQAHDPKIAPSFEQLPLQPHFKD